MSSPSVAEQRLEAGAVDRLLGDELLRERIEPIAMDLEDLRGSLEGPVDDARTSSSIIFAISSE